MNSMAKEVRILFAAIGLGLIGLVLLVQYTDICRLQAVTLNGEPMKQWDQTLGLAPSRNLFRQPLDSVADAMLTRNGIVHVDIKYQLPNGLSITTNDLEPVCYVLDDFSGMLYGVDQTGRCVVVEQATIDWEQPILTGVRVRGIHEFCADSRVMVLVPQLLTLQRDYPDIYRLIEDVNLSNPEYVRVHISGLRYSLRLPSDNFAARFTDFQKFMGRFKPATDGIIAFDLTYDDMIIRVGNVGQKKKAVVDTSSVNDVAELKSDSAPEPILIPAVKTTAVPTALTTKKRTEIKKSNAASVTTKKPLAPKKGNAIKKSGTTKKSPQKPSGKKSGSNKTKPATRKTTKKTS